MKIKSCVSEQERKKKRKERGKDEKSRRKRDREKNRLLYKLYFIGLWSENRSDDDFFFFFFSLVFTAERSRNACLFKNPAASPFPSFPSFFLLLLPCTFFPHMFHIYTKILYNFLKLYFPFCYFHFGVPVSVQYIASGLLTEMLTMASPLLLFIQQYSKIQQHQHCSRQYIAYSVWKYKAFLIDLVLLRLLMHTNQMKLDCWTSRFPTPFESFRQPFDSI